MMVAMIVTPTVAMAVVTRFSASTSNSTALTVLHSIRFDLAWHYWLQLVVVVLLDV